MPVTDKFPTFQVAISIQKDKLHVVQPVSIPSLQVFKKRNNWFKKAVLWILICLDTDLFLSDPDPFKM